MNKKRKIGEISDSCLGKMLDQKKNKGELKPYLSNKFVRWGGFELDNLPEMRFEDSEDERYGVRNGDLIICEGGEPGRCAIWRDEVPNMKIQKALHRVRLHDGYSVEYLYYRILLAARLGELKKHFIGSTIRHLTGIGLKQVEFDFPPFDTQKSIAKVLSDLDAKIDLNNRINSELEGMAKLIYDYWFVQFDFPISEAQAAAMGRPALKGKPYKSSGGKMVFNKELKRDVPEGWEVKKLGDFESNIVTGKTPSTKIREYFDGEVPFICIGDVRGNMHITKTELTLSKLGAETQVKKYIPEGSICVTCIASPGLVGFATEPSQTNQQLNSIVCQNAENRYYLYFALIDYFKGAKAKTGNTFSNMNKGDFSSIKILVPNKGNLIAFMELLDPMIQMILKRSKENLSLTELRDWLLPMLMNGQVRVLDDEEEVRMAAEPEGIYGVKNKE